MPASTALCEALNQGISSGIFVDTKIILYSRRDSSGRVCRPKVLYANSHVLKTVPYFQDRGCLATVNILEEPHVVGFKSSSGVSRRPNQRTSRKKLTKQNLQKNTDIYPIVTLRMMKMGAHFPGTQTNRRFVHPIRLRFWAMIRSPARMRTTSSVSKRARWSRSRTWRS